MTGNCAECTERWLCDSTPESCGVFPEPVKPTNADHIRALSDEELAKIFITTPSCVGNDCSEDGDCTKCMLYWLKQPYTDENG